MTKFDEREVDAAAMTNKPSRVRDAEDIAAATTVTIPGGVVLTSEEQQLRDHKTMDLSRGGIVARSILTKVRNACAGAV